MDDTTEKGGKAKTSFVDKFVPGKKKKKFFIVILCGLTFKPVVAYSVKDVKYRKRVEEVAKVCTKVCAFGLKVPTLWNTGVNIGHMFGCPLPNIPKDGLDKAHKFFDNVNSSSKVNKFLDKDDSLSMAELRDFGELLDELEKENRIRFYLGKEDKFSGKTWKTAFTKSVLNMKNDKRTITYISVEEAGKIGYKEDQVEIDI